MIKLKLFSERLDEPLARIQAEELDMQVRHIAPIREQRTLPVPHRGRGLFKMRPSKSLSCVSAAVMSLS